MGTKTTFQRLQAGFSVLPAGNYNGSYNNFGNAADFWSATEGSSPHVAHLRRLNYNDACSIYYNGYKDEGYSARCVKD